MMGTFWCLLSLAVIAARAESPKTPEEIYMACGKEKSRNCTRPIEEEGITASVRPEVKCRNVIKGKQCYEQACGPMPESIIKFLEQNFKQSNITCDIRGSGGNNSTGTGSGGKNSTGSGSGGNNSTGTGSAGNNSTGTGSGGNNFSDIGSVGAGSSGCGDIKIDFSLVATYISFLTIICFI